MATSDQNGNPVTKSVKREDDGTWSANVWFGSYPATNIRRYKYETRAQARDADISDEPGKRGMIGIVQ